jgi:hypothetical protein
MDTSNRLSLLKLLKWPLRQELGFSQYQASTDQFENNLIRGFEIQIAA